MTDSVLTMYTDLKKDLNRAITSNEGTLQYHRDTVKRREKELRTARGEVASIERKLGQAIEQLGHVTQQIMELKGEQTGTETPAELIIRLKTRMELLMDE